MKFLFLVLVFSLPQFFGAFAADKNAQTLPAKALPYLGPGADRMSPEEYQKVYKDYIQQSITLGYPFVEGAKSPCEQSLTAIFRQVGMFGYPVPAKAQQIQRAKKQLQGFQVELYEMAGVTIQLLREAKSGALDRLVLVNSTSTKASHALSQIAKFNILSVEKDKRTGLERLKGLPVGYPHPFLDTSAQGLYVRELKFNKSLDHCAPIAYTDNSWVGGFNLTDSICEETEKDVQGVWNNVIPPHTFADRERERMKVQMKKNAQSMGYTGETVDAMIARNFIEPYSNDVTVVGSAMKNIAECHQLAIGTSGQKKGDSSEPAPGTGNTGGGKSAQ